MIPLWVQPEQAEASERSAAPARFRDVQPRAPGAVRDEEVMSWHLSIMTTQSRRQDAHPWRWPPRSGGVRQEIRQDRRHGAKWRQTCTGTGSQAPRANGRAPGFRSRASRPCCRRTWWCSSGSELKRTGPVRRGPQPSARRRSEGPPGESSSGDEPPRHIEAAGRVQRMCPQRRRLMTDHGTINHGPHDSLSGKRWYGCSCRSSSGPENSSASSSPEQTCWLQRMSMVCTSRRPISDH